MKAFPASLQLHCIPLLILIGAGGCGLSDYQSRMDAQRVRVQEFDEANNLLDEPIDIPRISFKDPKDNSTREQKAWPFEIFLRLPKGYATAPKEKDPYKHPFPFYRYAGGSEGATSIFIAAAWIQDSKAKGDEWGRYFPASFRINVRLALEEYYEKTHKIGFVFPEKVEIKSREVKALTAYPDPSSPAKVPFKMIRYTDEGNKLINDHSVFEVYLREQGGKQVCLVIQRPVRPVNVETLNKSIEACLGSLEISSEATAKRYTYNAFKQAKKN